MVVDCGSSGGSDLECARIFFCFVFLIRDLVCEKSMRATNSWSGVRSGRIGVAVELAGNVVVSRQPAAEGAGVVA